MGRYIDGDRLAGDFIERTKLIAEKYSDKDWASQAISDFTELVMTVRKMQGDDTHSRSDEPVEDSGASVSWALADCPPSPMRDVLVCTRSKNGSRGIDKGYWDGERWIRRGQAEVTHWMPLPDLPEDGKNEISFNQH